MDHLKQGIGLRAYAQKDPLLEYKQESFKVFEDMKGILKNSIIESLFSVQLMTPEEMEEYKARQQAELDAQLEAAKQAQMREQEADNTPVRRGQSKVGRNDPCPCGSGKKYKQCHGK